MQLQHRQPDGSTLRQHLQAAAAVGGAPDPRLLQTVPPAGTALWAAFCALNDSRPLGLGGAGAIPMSEVHAWSQAYGVQLSPWELDTLRAMDAAAMAAEAQARKAAQQ